MIPPIIPDGPRLTPPDEGVPDDLDLLAAEYVLGSLTEQEERALLVNFPGPELQARIAVWEERLAPLGETVPAASPPPQLWQRLVLATGIGAQIRPTVDARLLRSQTPASNPAPFWRFTTAAATMIAAGLAMFILVPSAQVSEPLLAALSPSGAQQAAFIVRVDGTGLGTVFALTPPEAPGGRALQLWALMDAPKPPVSLGLLDAKGTVRLRVRSAAGTRLAVTLEPAGGSPTGKPTGPVIYTGSLTSGA